MSKTDVILSLIRAVPGLTDSEIGRRSGIRPHQQVNQICNRLATQGKIMREPGAAGSLVNLPIGIANPVALTPLPATLPRRWQPRVASHPSIAEIAALDRASTLLVIPCSGSKRSGHAPADRRGICDLLPASLAAELRRARSAMRQPAQIDETSLLPAVRRYCGTFYEAAGSEALRALSTKQPCLILSGGYGALLPTEAIGCYDAQFKPARWPKNVVGRSVAAYARHLGVAIVVGFLAASTGYAKVIRSVCWSAEGIDCAFLVSAEAGPGGGAMRKVPATLGEALAAYLQEKLSTAWRSSHGLTLDATRLA